MKWIKASERLPEDTGVYCCRLVTCACAALQFYAGGVFDTDYLEKNIEWLDETESLDSDGWIGVDKQRALKMRNDAVSIFELIKGFTTETNDNAMKSAIQMAGYVLELTNYK